MLVRKDVNMSVRDCKVMPREACIPQHRLLSLDLVLEDSRKYTERKGLTRIKVWKLKDEDIRQEYETEVRRRIETNRVGWREHSDNLVQAARIVCGVTSGRRKQRRLTW